MRTVLAVLLALGLAAGPAYAAGGADDTLPGLTEEDAERLRQAGEQACTQIMDSASLLSQRLQEVGLEMQRLMLETRTQMAREMAPAMRELAEQLNEMARSLEQPPRKKEGT